MASFGPAPLFTNHVNLGASLGGNPLVSAPQDRAPTSVSAYPIATGSSVFGIKYEGGVLLGADTLVSYGKMARYPGTPRLYKVNETTVITCSGDFADFQCITALVERMQIEEERTNNEVVMQPRSLHRYLTRYLYNLRSKFDPKWTNIVVGGLQDGEPYLGYVSMIGLAFTEEAVTTGLGGAVALPLIRKHLDQNSGRMLTFQEATKIMEESIKLGFALDCVAYPKYQIANITKEGVHIGEPETVKLNWKYVKNFNATL
uniref:Proteasome subunit beta n=1 Tax=Caligus rogercresseyi TaxID=217165 RepID=C1BQ97_CALRO|nr:Proteasome subunit beta type-4 precursor [Caligus rogercresseyi]|eukprot:TRINITY_DN18517_c0_g1_i1.p1 TRINITY_DN18517_c0_g1~~TRINITY_DN18517_c0_g1_i1.p1  ORF type:complete len:288 (-),score=76.21 TRINITY_DN18517_c0_g1_i1:74-850(-)